MFENQTEQNRVQLYDGALCRMDLIWHKRPVFVADADGLAFNIAGELYSADGQPLNPKAPRIVEIVRYQ